MDPKGPTVPPSAPSDRSARLLLRTLTMLQVGADSAERARELGQMGYMQWLGGLPGSACYRTEAGRALQGALPFATSDAPVAVFCGLLSASLRDPLTPLDLALPRPRRRGGAQDRRMSL